MKPLNVEVGHVGVDALFDDKGELRVGYKNMGREDMEILKTLQSSPYWKYYRELLIKAKEAYFNSTLAMKDPHEMMKNVGMVAGINFAINQIAVIVSHHEAVEKRKQAEALKELPDFTRG